MRQKMNWPRLETRLKNAIRKAPGLDKTELSALIVRLDTIIASETRRATALSNEQRAALCNVADLDSIEDEEWKVVEK